MERSSTSSGHREVNAAELLLMMSSGWNAPSSQRSATAPPPSTEFPSAPVTSVSTSTYPPVSTPTSAPLHSGLRVHVGCDDEPRQRARSRKSGLKDAVRKRVHSFKGVKLLRPSTSTTDIKKTGKKLLERLALHLDLAFLDKVDGASALTPEQFDQLGLTEEELVYYNSRAERDKTKALFKMFFCQRESLPIVPPEMACKRCKNDSWCCYLRKEMAHPRRGRKMKSCAGCHASKAECIWPNKQNEAPDYSQIIKLNKADEAVSGLPTPRSGSNGLPRLSLPSSTRKKKAEMPTPPPDSTLHLTLERASSHTPSHGTGPLSRDGSRGSSYAPSRVPSREDRNGDTSRASSLAPTLPPIQNHPHGHTHLLAPSPIRPAPRFLSRASSPALHVTVAGQASSPDATSSKRGRSPSPNDDQDRRAPSLPKRRRTVSPSSTVPAYAADMHQKRGNSFWAVDKPRANSERPRTQSHPNRPAVTHRTYPVHIQPQPQPTTPFLRPATEEDHRALSRRGYTLTSQAVTPRLKCTNCKEHNLVCAFPNLPQARDGIIPLQACIESASISRRSVWRFPVAKTTGTAYLSARVNGVLLPPTLRAIEEAGAWCDINSIQTIQEDDIAAQLAHGLDDTPSFLSAFEVIHPHLHVIAPALGLSVTPRPIAEGERYLLAQGVNQRARAVHLRMTASGLDILKAVEGILLSEITPALAKEVVCRLPGWNGEAVVNGDKTIRLLIWEGGIGALVEEGEQVTVYGCRAVLALAEFPRGATKVECKPMEVMALFGPETGTGIRHWCASVIAQDQVLACEVVEIARKGGVEEVLRLVREAGRSKWCEACKRLRCVC